jgi:hypothetical protein
MWLNRGTIDGGDNAVAAMLAYITFHHRERIAISVRGNELKARWIDIGIFLGPVAPIVFRNCPGWGLGSEQAEGIRQGCRIAGQGVDDGPALLLGG